MSLLSSNGGFFGRKRNETPRSETWDPYKEYHGLGGIPIPAPPHMPFPTDPSTMINTRREWKETPEAYMYKTHLPGLNRNDVRVEVDDDRVLCIICEKNVEKREQREGWHKVELSSDHFVHRLTLPQNSMVDQIKAHMENEVLTIRVPKRTKVTNHRVRNISISSQ
ncbi:18.1 kDa class I heat shock protein-like [Abrus precatorius]|uniref:18.1 kDa class I heat shock protein-like n=1 Tax=Abrus precatorius TaxID=3816 RepID=A0A8B8L9U7_ABRPR|nr:18.1 kDa class I heat shock protein-like [Abrus precatorius]